MAQGSWCQTTRFALFYCALLFVLFCSVQTLSAQEDDTRVVSGTVVNEKSEVVVGATVSAQSKHAQRSATTDNQGNFLLRMPVEAMTLTVSWTAERVDDVPQQSIADGHVHDAARTPHFIFSVKITL